MVTLLACFILTLSAQGAVNPNTRLRSAAPSSQSRLLVSLGMPTLVLRQYVRQAQRLHIPLVIRGMYKGSMQATGRRVYHILHPAHEVPLKSGVLIDPVWFKRYHVKVVPTLIVVCGQSFSRVSGNISLSSLLLTVVAHSRQVNVVQAAKTVLKRSR